jgi:GNAT superfamily N-acetyltransferase
MGDWAVTDYRVHARNAAAMWEALAKGHGALLVGTEAVRIVAPSPYHALRAIVLDPYLDREATVAAIVQTVLEDSGVARRVVEDASGVLDLGPSGLSVRFRLTVMAREPGPVPASPAEPDIGVVAVADQRSLLEAEQILMAVFPPPTPPTYLRGRIQPARVLELPGWRVWLGYRDGVPAGAAYTYHDGASLGVYQVSALPEHRGHGIGRALMDAILRAHSDDVVTLSATDQGRRLYNALDFHVCSEAVWWWPNPTGDDSGEGLR